MNKYTKEQLIEGLVKLNIYPGDLVIIHSSLFNLGILEGVSIRNIPHEIFEILQEYLTSTGTMIVPTFNFAFCKGIAFDRQKTPSDQMGVFSEFLRLQPQSIRSYHPMQSVTGIGRFAAEICDIDSASAFSGGPFELLLKKKAKILLLGISFEAASMVHYAEEVMQVPYRYWKDFSGNYIDGGKNSFRTYKMYVRNLNPVVELDLSVIDAWMKEKGLLRSCKLGSGFIHSCNSVDFIDIVLSQLKKDAYCLVQGNAQLC